ncbi:MAG: energy-coupling factor transporter ATPase [Anaerolineales bacterium]
MSSSSPAPLVSFEGVTFYHFERTTPTLSKISFTLPRGSLTLLVGPSGSGKSTLCMLMTGIVPHLLGGVLEGQILVDGKDVAQTAVKDLALSAGLLFQDPEWMFATLRVDDEVAFGPENLKIPKEEIHQRVQDALEMVDLTRFRHHLVWALSGGQIQKLGFASVLAMQPPLMILDEPTANLDPATTHAVHEMILRLREQGKTIVLVSKDLDEFIAEADNLIYLANGKIVAQGEPRQVIREAGLDMLQAGVWLPEPTEIGLRLQEQGKLTAEILPLTVTEAKQTFSNLSFVSSPIEVTKSKEMGETLIEAENLQYAYNPKEPALRGVSFTVRQGEMVAIIGQNGAGKSTLAKLLVGLLKPTSGRLRLFGKDAAHWKVAELANQIALVFQNPEHQFLCDTVFEELSYSLLAKGVIDPTVIQERVVETLRQLDLQDYTQTHPFALSEGAKRRLGVATMLVGGGARVLIVDEPTYGQDRRMTERLMEYIHQLRQQGITVIMITHDMRLVEAHIDRAIVMAEGRILYDGDPQTLFDLREIIHQANLRPTALYRMLTELRQQAKNIPHEINTVEKFIQAVQ